MIIAGINQFKKSAVEKVLKQVTTVAGTLLTPTVSICPECVYHIPAYKYHKNNEVWMVKHCAQHGISHHKIENDYEFYSQFKEYHLDDVWNFNNLVHVEGTDRCNLECPHCYHLPDNKIVDVSREEIINKIKSWPFLKDVTHLLLAGAESSLRKDFVELVKDISDLGLKPGILTNGIKFGDLEFLQESLDAGLFLVNVGLNHPDYNNYETVRKKQVRAIEALSNSLALMGYISYTMISLDEIDYILDEIVNNNWNAFSYRIRAGSDIGRNSTTGRLYLSDHYKALVRWCEKNNKHYEILEKADNNLYHVVVMVEGKPIRLIQWCDITDIDMENLRCGPWCDFTPGPVTNFLHQVIIRDEWKNKGKILPDVAPERYHFAKVPSNEPLDLLKLKTVRGF
jgi:organic radical activating enzyme